MSIPILALSNKDRANRAILTGANLMPIAGAPTANKSGRMLTFTTR